MRSSIRFFSFPAFVVAVLAGCSAAPDGGSSSAPEGATPRAAVAPQTFSRRACPHARPGEAECDVHVGTDAQGNILWKTTAEATGGIGPATIQAAYRIPSTLNLVAAIAIVDPYDDPTAGSDLALYRQNYGLPPLCDSCFKRVNQTGGTSSYPSGDGGAWVGETSLDLEMASAACPSCNIILVEANTEKTSDLFAAVDTAVSEGADVISLSWSGVDDGDDTALSHPGVAIFAGAGDSGYGTAYPASSTAVTSVGGTVLTAVTPTAAQPRGFTETAWSNGGSGCTSEPKPAWQHDSLCANRMVADVSAIASPGVAVVANGLWYTATGTSVSTPVVAGIYAATGNGEAPLDYPYVNTGDFFDVTSGSNGSCGGTYFCTATPGYDGPTGNGTPNAAAMAGYPEVTSISPAAGTNAGGTFVTIHGLRFDTSGGTTITFGGKPAVGVSCSSATTCTAYSPSYSEIDTSEAVDVVVTVQGLSSLTGPQDLFTYGAGPNCTSNWSCAGISFGFPDTVVTCPETVDFYDYAGSANQTFLSAGTTVSLPTNDVQNTMSACTSTGCTEFSVYEASSSYCGAPPTSPPPPKCDGVAAPPGCTIGWHCCGSQGWRCGVCE